MDIPLRRGWEEQKKREGETGREESERKGGKEEEKERER